MQLVASVEVLPNEELLISIEGGGKPYYQHVYRAGAAVYWDNERGGFVSRGRKSWTYPDWYQHIAIAAQNELGKNCI